MTSLPSVTIHTDGACSGNPGPGGWGAILKFGDVEKELKGERSNIDDEADRLTELEKDLGKLDAKLQKKSDELENSRAELEELDADIKKQLKSLESKKESQFLKSW